MHNYDFITLGQFPDIKRRDANNVLRMPVIDHIEVEPMDHEMTGEELLNVTAGLGLHQSHIILLVRKITHGHPEDKPHITTLIFKKKTNPNGFGFRWVPMQFKEGVITVMVWNPDRCAKCDGTGEINWGRQTTMVRGIPTRICYTCKGRGVFNYHQED